MAIHYCEHCKEHEAEVSLTTTGGDVHYLCASPECMMSAGVCPSCGIDLEVTVKDTGQKLYSCSSCSFEQTYEELGQA